MQKLYACDLKKRYRCFGHFYDWVRADGERVPCRSVLEIVDAEVPQQPPDRLANAAPDAVVIMMNPGSSHPIDAAYEPKSRHYPCADDALKELVLTRPDNTQYQVMRIAIEYDWHHIRVLNLSDVRDPKSSHFLQRIAAWRPLADGDHHSLFSSIRFSECQRALQRKTATPILLGWGQLPGLIPWAEQCLDRLGREPTAVVSSSVHPALSAHPSPMRQAMKEAWLENMLAKIEQQASR